MKTSLIARSNTSLEISSLTEIGSLSRTKQPSCIELQCWFWQNQTEVAACESTPVSTQRAKQGETLGMYSPGDQTEWQGSN